MFSVCSSGACFIRTDQLDGETDWKLRVAVGCTQRLPALGVRIRYDVVNLCLADEPTERALRYH